MLMLQTCGGGRHCGDRHGAPASEGLQFGEQVGAPDGQSTANPGHAVNLRKRSQHDHVLIGLHQVECRKAVRKMDVGLVHEHHRTFWFRGQELFDAGMRRHRSCGIVRRTHIEKPGVRRRR